MCVLRDGEHVGHIKFKSLVIHSGADISRSGLGG